MKSKCESVYNGTDIRLPAVNNLVSLQCSLAHQEAISAVRKNEIADCSRMQQQGDENMLGLIAIVLIVLLLLGFFAFHVTAAFIHVALVVGLILLVLHFMRRSPASV